MALLSTTSQYDIYAEPPATHPVEAHGHEPPSAASGRLERARLVDRLARLEPPALGSVGRTASGATRHLEAEPQDAVAQDAEPQDAAAQNLPPTPSADAPPSGSQPPRLANRIAANREFAPASVEDIAPSHRSAAEIIAAIAAAAAVAEPAADPAPIESPELVAPPLVAPPLAAVPPPDTDDDGTADELQALLAEARSAADAAFDEPQSAAASALAAAEAVERPPMIIERAQQTGVGDRSGAHAEPAGSAWPAFASGFALAVLLGAALYLKLPAA